MHRGGVGNEAKGRVTVRLLESVRGQAVDAMVRSGMEVGGVRGSARTRRRRVGKVFSTEECSAEMKWQNVLY